MKLLQASPHWLEMTRHTPTAPMMGWKYCSTALDMTYSWDIRQFSNIALEVPMRGVVVFPVYFLSKIGFQEPQKRLK